MKRTRRKSSAAFKAKVATEALKGLQTLAQLTERLSCILNKSGSGNKNFWQSLMFF